MRVYFDNAATTPICEKAIEAMTAVMRETYGNPSSIHKDGRQARAAIEEARKTVANAIDASIGEIFFTSGGTESNNMALKCSVRDLGVRRIISSPTEHHCILHTLESLENNGVEICMVQLDKNGTPDYADLERLLNTGNKKTLVSLMHGNNEIGSFLDLNRVSELCQANNALFHTDTIQTMGYYPINVERTKVDFLTGSAHKFHGPKGIGFIYINGDNVLKPFVEGGAQERNMRGGTENIYGIVGLAKALELAIDEQVERRAKIEAVRDHFKQQLLEHFEDIQFNNNAEDAVYKVLSVSFPPSPKSALLLLNLDISGISASGGSACSSGAEKGSHVIQAIKGDPNRKTIRFSFSHKNTLEEVDYVIEKLKNMVPVKETVVA